MQNVVQASTSDNQNLDEVNNHELGESSTPLSSNSSPTKSETDNFSEQPRYMSDSSESDEDDASEVESFVIDQDGLVDPRNKFLLNSDDSDTVVDAETQARLEALLEAAGIGKLSTTGDGKHLADPEVLRRLTSSVSCALDEAAAALTRMRSERACAAETRSLVEACSDGDVGAVRKLLGEGRSVNETNEEGESLLSLACSAGYYELAQVLLAMHANVEDRGVKGDCTPLMEAASAGFVDIVRLLIAHGADVNAQSSSGNTPLMYACAGGHEAVVKELLEAGANVEDHNENGHTPLMEAASAGYVEVAKILLNHGAGINTHSNEFKESALTLACYKGHLAMVRFLLDAGADQEHKTDEMHTALMEASMDGHVEVAKLLLDSGAQVNMPTDSFESPLTLAACGGHVDLALLLIERGANIEEVNDEGYTPLMEAAREGHERMVSVLLQRGANINAQTEETQETALTLACCGGFLEVADYLIKNGAALELGASTPLMEAAQEGHIHLVKYLLDASADVHANTQTGDTALTYACENGHTDVADLLLQYGANLEHESEGGRTPLMKACRAGHVCTVRFLISKNADVNRRTTNNDHTPLSLASAGGHLAVVELLLAHNADPFHKLKDNSTMLIEAAKGGHVSVVQLLLDYPHSIMMANQAQLQAQQAQLQAQETQPQTQVQPQTFTQTETLAQIQSQQQVQTPLQSQPQLQVQTQLQPPTQLSTQLSTAMQSQPQIQNQLQIQSQLQVQHQLAAQHQLQTQPQPQLQIQTQLQPQLQTQPHQALEMTEDILDFSSAKATAAIGRLADKLTPALKISSTSNSPVQAQKSLLRKCRLDPLSENLAENQVCNSSVNEISDKSDITLDESSTKLNVTIEQQLFHRQQIVEELQRVERELKDSGGSLASSNPPLGLNLDLSLTAQGLVSMFHPNTAATLSSLHNTIYGNGAVTPPPSLITSQATATETPSQQSTAISDRPKAKPVSKKDGKNNRKQQQLLVAAQLSKQAEFLAGVKTGLQIGFKSHVQSQDPNYNLRVKHFDQINDQVQELIEQSNSTSSQVVISEKEMYDHNQLMAKLQQLDPSLTTGHNVKMLPCDMVSSSLHCQQIVSNEADTAALQDKLKMKPEELENLDTLTFNEFAIATSEAANRYQVASAQFSPSLDESMLASRTPLPIFPSEQEAVQYLSVPSSGLQVTQQGIQQISDLRALNRRDGKEIYSRFMQNPPMLAKTTQPAPQPITPTQHVQVATQTMPDSTKQKHTSSSNSSRSNNTTATTAAPSTPGPSTTGKGKKPRNQAQNRQNHSHNISSADLKSGFAGGGKEDGGKEESKPPSVMDVDSETDSNHDTALTLACAGGYDELVELLLSRGADIEHRDKKGFTPLILAATAGHEKVVEALLNHSADMEAQSERTKDTPLSLACSGGRYEVVELLLARGANKEHRNVSDYTPLSLAASGGYVNIIKLLLNHGAEINSRTGSKLGISPLMLAAMNGHTAAVKLLLDMGSDINAQIETNRNTALTLACFQGRHEVVSLLLDRKANVEHRAKTGLTPLMEAASGGYVEVGRVLLSKGADVNASPVPSSRDTALTIAADKGHYRFVELLITSRCVQVEVKNKKGNSPLWLAANGGHLPVVELLYNVGADIDSQDNRKVSCLMAAFRKGHIKVVKWMVNHVTQFPSDIEMTRFISTINDPELLEKCHECIKIITVAKDQQAAKANKNASILLEELHMEKSKEESKKQAAARKRERKKQKKRDKKEGRRVMVENAKNERYNEEPEPEEEEEEEVIEEEEPVRVTNNKKNRSETTISNKKGNQKKNKVVEVEEGGDSGIDANSQGSCSSNDVAKQVSKERTRKEKKKKGKGNNVESSSLTTGSSPSTSVDSRVSSSPSSNKKDKDKEAKKGQSSQPANVNYSKNIENSSKSKQDSNTKSNKSSVSKNSSTDNSSSSNASHQRSGSERRPKVQQPLVFEATRHPADGEEFDITSNESFSAGIKGKKSSSNSNCSNGSNNTNNQANYMNYCMEQEIFPGKGSSSNKQGGKREEGWKEVVRKYLNSPFRAKKVSVPLHAISRVIGRGGSNINTIRTTTGAFIEIEKQSKGQGERIITIKGSMESTKQAQNLIQALITDPELDLVQMLPKTAKTPAISWGEKTTTANKLKTSAPTLKTTLTSMPQPTPLLNFPPSLVSLSAPPPVMSSAAVTSLITPRVPASLATSRPTAPRLMVAASEKKSVTAAVVSSNTKTTMLYTTAITSSGRMTKVVTTTTTPSTATTTFAAKLSSDSNIRENLQHQSVAMSAPQAPRPLLTTVTSPAASSVRTTPVVPSKPAFSSPSVQPIQQPQLQPPQQQPPSTPQASVGNSSVSQNSAVSSPPEYSLFNDTFSKVAQKSMWGRDEDNSTQRSMNFASVAATGAPNSAVSGPGLIGPANNKFLDSTPPQVDASKAPGYRGGTSVCSPVLHSKSAPPPSSNNHSSPPPSLSFTNLMSEPPPNPMQPPPNVAVVRPENSNYPTRPVYSEEYTPQDSPGTLLKMVPPSETNLYHSNYSQAPPESAVSMSRLNPRAPDFSSLKQSLPPAPPQQTPLYNQPPPPTNYMPQPLPSAVLNSNVISFSVNKYLQQPQQPRPNGQTRWPFVAAAPRYVGPQQDLSNSHIPSMASLSHNQAGDLFTGLENGNINLPNSGITPPHISPPGMAEDRKVPPRPIGTERAWKMAGCDQEWMLDQKIGWNPVLDRQQQQQQQQQQHQQQQQQQAYRSTTQYSRIPVPDEIQPIMDSSFTGVVGDASHFNGGTALPMSVMHSMPPLAHFTGLDSVACPPDSIIKTMEPSWDPRLICLPEIPDKQQVRFKYA